MIFATNRQQAVVFSFSHKPKMHIIKHLAIKTYFLLQNKDKHQAKTASQTQNYSA